MKTKGYYRIRRYSSNGGYRHIEITVKEREDFGSRAEILLSWQAGGIVDNISWYGFEVVSTVNDPEGSRFAQGVARAITVKQDGYESFATTPREVMAALAKAGYMVVVRNDKQGGRYKTPGRYYCADVPSWGYVWSENDRSMSQARATVLEQLPVSYAKQWANTDFAMDEIEISQPNWEEILDPELSIHYS